MVQHKILCYRLYQPFFLVHRMKTFRLSIICCSPRNTDVTEALFAKRRTYVQANRQKTRCSLGLQKIMKRNTNGHKIFVEIRQNMLRQHYRIYGIRIAISMKRQTGFIMSTKVAYRKGTEFFGSKEISAQSAFIKIFIFELQPKK